MITTKNVPKLQQFYTNYKFTGYNLTNLPSKLTKYGIHGRIRCGTNVNTASGYVVYIDATVSPTRVDIECHEKPQKRSNSTPQRRPAGLGRGSSNAKLSVNLNAIHCLLLCAHAMKGERLVDIARVVESQLHDA